MVSNLCEGQRTIRSPSTRSSQGTIPDTVGLCVHEIFNTAPIPMDASCQEAPASTVDNAADVTMRAESISSGPRTSSTISGETVMNIEQLIWNNLVTQQCAPMVCKLLDDADFYPIGTM
eukprot:5730621-Amphidinium_carterae.2